MNKKCNHPEYAHMLREYRKEPFFVISFGSHKQNGNPALMNVLKKVGNHGQVKN